MKRGARMLAVLLLVTGPAAAQSTFLVHLPGAPVESASRLAEGVAALADYLSDEVPGLTLELQLFRRWSDAQDFLATRGDGVVLVLADAGFLLDPNAAAGLVATHRLRSGGAGTYRCVLVARPGAAGEVPRLVDLRGRTLAVVETAASSDAAYLRRAVFEGEVDPASWFTATKGVADDFEAVNAALYGQTDAALVAEHNPLLEEHLGEDLVAVYTSPPLSMPVLAVRESAFGADRRRALDGALRGLGGDLRGEKFLAELKLEGFESLSSREARALASLPPPAVKELEIALPAGGAPELDLPPRPAAAELSFTLAVELPDVPLPREDGEN